MSLISLFTRVPAQELLLPLKEHGAWPDRMAIGIPFAGQEDTDPVSHIRVARCSQGTYIMAYIPVRQPVVLDTSGLKGTTVEVSHYDPERGTRTACYPWKNTGWFTIIPERDLGTLIALDASSP